MLTVKSGPSYKLSPISMVILTDRHMGGRQSIHGFMHKVSLPGSWSAVARFCPSMMENAFRVLSYEVHFGFSDTKHTSSSVSYSSGSVSDDFKSLETDDEDRDGGCRSMSVGVPAEPWASLLLSLTESRHGPADTHPA